MSLKNKVIKNIFSNWAGLVITIAVSFFMAPYVVHKLGNTFYGVWSIINQFTAYLYLFDFGIRESVIRYTARYMADRSIRKLEEILKASFYIYLAIAVLSVLITIVFSYVFVDIFNVDESYATEVSIAVLIIGGTISQIFVFNVFNGFLMGNQRYDIFNIIQISATLIRTALFVVVLEMGYGIVALAAVQFIVFLCSGIIMMRVSIRLAATSNVKMSFAIPVWQDLRATFKKVFNYSFYVFINNIGQKIIFTTDAIIIGIFMPIASVTFYAIAGTLIEYLRKLVVASSEVLNPLVSHYSVSNEREKIHYALVTGTKLTLFIALPIAATFVLLGENFIGLWMGDEFAKDSGKVLLILAVAQVFSAPHFSISSVLYGLNKHKVLAYFRIVEAIINLVLSIILIQDYGLVGVALGTAIPHIIIVSLILPIYATRTIGISLGYYFLAGYVRPFLAIIPFLIACIYVKSYMLPQSLAGFFGYIIMLSVMYVLISYAVIFTSTERKSINNSVIEIYKRKFSK